MPAISRATIRNNFTRVLEGPAFATAQILDAGAALYVFKRSQQAPGRLQFRCSDNVLHSDLGELQWVGKKWPSRMQLRRRDIYVCRGCVAFQVSEVVLGSTHMLGVREWGQEGAYSSEWVPGYNGRPPTMRPRWCNAWDKNFERDLADWRMERGRYQQEGFDYKPYWWQEKEVDVSRWSEKEVDTCQWSREFVEERERTMDWSKADWMDKKVWEAWEEFTDEPGNTAFNPIDLTEEEELEGLIVKANKVCTVQ